MSVRTITIHNIIIKNCMFSCALYTIIFITNLKIIRGLSGHFTQKRTEKIKWLLIDYVDYIY